MLPVSHITRFVGKPGGGNDVGENALRSIGGNDAENAEVLSRVN